MDPTKVCSVGPDTRWHRTPAENIPVCYLSAPGCVLRPPRLGRLSDARERERVRCRILPKATYTPFSAHLNCADGSEEFARSACWEESTNGLEGGRLYSRAVP